MDADTTGRATGSGRADRGPSGRASANNLTVAIDGPAASGKSTIARAVAERMGLLYLDTGAMYRAVAWLVLGRGIDPTDESAVTALAQAATFAFPERGRADRVNPPIVIDGLDATAGLREPAVEAAVSAVAGFAGVREALVRRQQEIARERGTVMAGRDIGTVVLPDANLKVFLVASPAERARRRCEERAAQGQPASYDEVLTALSERDRLDTDRAHSPLRPAADAISLDTTALTIDEAVQRVLALARAAQTDRDRAHGARLGPAEPS